VNQCFFAGLKVSNIGGQKVVFTLSGEWFLLFHAYDDLAVFLSSVAKLGRCQRFLIIKTIQSEVQVTILMLSGVL